MALQIGIEEIEKKLFEREKKLDRVLSENRLIVRHCSNAIKAIHGREPAQAKAELAEAERLLLELSKHYDEFPSHIDHVYQEYSEARIVLSAVETGKIPSCSEIGVPEIPYLLGLLDGVGELKREMYESLRRKDRAGAESFFKMMEDVYDALLPLRFSNSVLPDFRRKQDVARMQIEQARGELL